MRIQAIVAYLGNMFRQHVLGSFRRFLRRCNTCDSFPSACLASLDPVATCVQTTSLPGHGKREFGRPRGLLPILHIGTTAVPTFLSLLDALGRTTCCSARGKRMWRNGATLSGPAEVFKILVCVCTCVCIDVSV